MTPSYTREGLRAEVETFLQMIAAGRVPGAARDAAAMRALDEAMAAMLNLGAPPVALDREIQIPTPAGDVRALVYAPERKDGELLPVVQYTHGGGFVIMRADTVTKLCKRIAVEARAVVVSVDYRRAPEHPYPAPLDDSVAAFRWLREHAREFGGDPARISTAGDSAGGNLAAATALRLQRDGEQLPDAVIMACAWTDLAMTTRSFGVFGPDDLLIDSEIMSYWRSCYVPQPAGWADPLVSPLRADLSSFPPACIIAAGIDPLYDDNVLFAEKLRAAGRDVELHEYPGMPHDFLLFPQLEPLTDVVTRITGFLRRVQTLAR